MATYINADGVLDWNRVMSICDPPQPKFARKWSPNNSGFLEPCMIVIHYTAGGAMSGSSEWLCNSDSKVSAHFLIGRNGNVEQLVSLDRMAWHCGRSEYEGLRDCNQFAIGIELCNWGPLLRDDDTGLFYPVANQRGSVVLQPPKVHESPCEIPGSIYRYWEKFPTKQLYSLGLVTHALCRSLPIHHFVGHNEIAPRRKIDPGPAFDLDLFRKFAQVATRL